MIRVYTYLDAKQIVGLPSKSPFSKK